MTANLIRGLLILGLVVLMAVPPVLAEAAETEGMATGAAVGTDRSNEQVIAPAAHLFESVELASFEARAEEPSEEVAGGALSNQHLTYIVIALAAAVVVLILV